MMQYNTNDELRAYFLKQIQSVSEADISKVKAEVDRITQKKIAEIEDAAKLKADIMLQQETKILNSEQSLNISRLTEQNNQKKMMMREQLIEELFKEIKIKLQEYAQSETYRNIFKARVIELSKQYPYDGDLHVLAADQDIAKKAISTCEGKLKVIVDDSITLGGFFLEFTKAALVVDETLDAKLQDEMNAFYENPELILE
jgi:V/A-type H+-transporting ATPase subunit E